MQILQHLDAVYLAKGFMVEGVPAYTCRQFGGEQYAVMWALKALPLLTYVAQEAKDRGWEPTGNWYSDYVEPLGDYIHEVDVNSLDEEFKNLLVAWLVDKAGEFFMDSQGDALDWGADVLREGLKLIELPQV